MLQKTTQKTAQDRPWGAPGPFLKADSFFNTFLTPLGLPIGLPLGSLWASILESIFDSFSGTLRKRLQTAFGLILKLFCLHFGSLFGSFSGHLRKVKIELSPRRELSSAHGRTPQMEPENWVAHGRHKNEARGTIRKPT